ncbi:uncharacterized protein LOC111060687 [Nilaparvata lugens]|uniref:uncharacterized protein LOC111060687 n=1 Tax=Nilaparvata lugens TaxID=108931 RepID=UPI00193C98B2|nr:uncharacterized protein LOC111060687 [Nilaparvata lugens]
MAQEPSITREVSIVSSKGLTEDRPKPASLSVSSSRKSRRSKTPRMPMFLNCPPNPPYTNYMDEEPTLKYYKERKLSHKEKYDYSSITKASRLQCLTNLRYKTMDEIEAGEKSTYGKPRKIAGAEEEDCYRTEFITIPAPRYPPKTSQPTDQDLDTFSLPSANSQQPSNDLEDQATADQTCSKDNETIESYSDTSVSYLTKGLVPAKRNCVPVTKKHKKICHSL